MSAVEKGGLTSHRGPNRSTLQLQIGNRFSESSMRWRALLLANTILQQLYADEVLPLYGVAYIEDHLLC
jgi:hypothetical protein